MNKSKKNLLKETVSGERSAIVHLENTASYRLDHATSARHRIWW